MRYLLLLLMFVIGNVSAYDYTIRSSFSNWTTSGGFGTCHPYTQSKPCISDGTYAGVAAGNVVFAYTTQTIEATITLESSIQNSSSTYYLSLDAMVGPYTASNQSVKYETLAITVYLKNQSGGTIATKTFSQNITNTTMDTYVLELGSFSGVYSMTVYISGKDGGYWNGNYGAELEAGSVLLSDYDPTNAGPTTSTTTGTSAGPTSTQATTKSSAETRRDSYSGDDNGIYIDQAGDNNSITILQASPNNQIRGINQQRAKMWGDNNTYDIRQGADTSVGINLIELSVDGNLNDITLYQDRYDAGNQDGSASGDHILRLFVDGNSNTVSTNQRSQTNYDGHFGEINIVGNSNSVDLLQRSLINETAFIDITGDSNVVNLLQENLATSGGNKFADIKLTGDGHTVNLEQSGTGGHQATIDLTYGSASSTVNLDQLGSTNQSYSIEQTCYTAGGCSTTVTQQ